MNAFPPFVSAEWWQLAGWTMIHFLWIGAAVAALALPCRFLLRKASPNIRYAAALVSLLSLAAMPVAIAAWLQMNHPTQSIGADSDRALAPLAEPAPLAQTERTTIELNNAALPATISAPAADNPVDVAATSAEPSQAARGVDWRSLQSYIAYLPWLWLIGTPLTFVLLAMGVVGTKRLRQSSQTIDDSRIVEILARACTALEVRARVGIAVCDRIATPVLIGIVRPMILLPPAAITGWSPDEIEMVLLHELAHVRRWDNLINLVQRCIESLLFFHPAVWLVSAWVRRERESCCDAIVVRRTQRPHAYAELLVALAAQMPRSVLFYPAASSAMATGPLRNRIRRILQQGDDPMLISGKSLTLMLATVLTVLVATLLYAPKIGQADEPAENGVIASDIETRKALDNAKARSVLPFAVDFTKGTSRFLDGDKIEITEVRGTAGTFVPGNIYRVKGTYTLASHDRAHVSAFTTAKEAKDGTGPIWPMQTTPIDRGTGTFEVFLPMSTHGWPHLSFYPIGMSAGSFGGIYFGTGDSVLKEDWPFAGMEERLAVATHDHTPAATEPDDGKVIKRLPADIITGELVAIIDSLIASGEAKGKNILIALPPKTRVSQFELARAMRERHGAGKIADASTAWIQGDEIELTIQPATPSSDPTTQSANDWLNDANFANDQDRDIAKRAWKELGVKFVPASEQELLHIRRSGMKGGLKALDLDNELNVTSPVIFTHLQSPPINTGIPDFASLNAALDKLVAGQHAAMVVLQGINKKNGIIQYSIRWPVKDRVLDELNRFMNPATGRGQVSDALARKLAGFEPGERPAAKATDGASGDSPSHPKFPTLEDQKLADLPYKLMDLEAEPLSEEDQKRVRALGYEGGVKVVVSPMLGNGIKPNDLLVGLHAWPTTNLKQLAEVLQRDDLADLNPLKFYVVRHDNPADGGPLNDTVVTGRVSVNLQDQKRATERDDHRRSNAAIAELQALQQHVAILREQFTRVDALYQAGNPGGSVHDRAVAGYELARAESDLALAQGKVAHAVSKLETAQQYAEEAQTAANAAYDAGAVANDTAIRAAREVANLKHRLAQVRALQTGGANPPDQTAPTDSSPKIDRTDDATGLPVYIAPSPDNEESRPNPARRRSGNDAPAPSDTRRYYWYTPAAPAAGKDALRYDGKSFAEWRDLLKNELSSAKRADAVRALAAFGRAGYGKEATGTILDVAGDYDFFQLDGAVQKAVLEELTPEARSHALAEHWVPDLAARVKKDPKKWNALAGMLLDRLRSTDPDVTKVLQELATTGPSELRTEALRSLINSGKTRDDKLKVDDASRQLLNKALSSDDPMTVRMALNMLINYPPFSPGKIGESVRPKLIYQPEIVPLLFSQSAEIQREARGALQYIGVNDAPQVVEQLINLLNSDQRKSDLLATIRALSVLGEKAEKALPFLKKQIRSQSDKEALIATYVAIELITGNKFGAGDFTSSLSDEESKLIQDKMGKQSQEGIEKSVMKENDLLKPPGNYLGGGGGMF